jgi:hypothetical protein
MAAPMSTLNSFVSWTSKYTSWTDLKAWLQESEPSVEVIEFEDSPYAILKSGKDSGHPGQAEAQPEAEQSAAQSEASQLCRSVVWDKRSNLPCSVAPFAARRDQKIPLDQALRIEDFIEGVMINVFRTKGLDGASETHVTTRSRIDADGTFYSERTFRELFEEAMESKRVCLDDIEAVMGDPELMGDDVQSTFISLVLAHPEHRVVKSVESANFWAIYRGVVKNDGTVNFYTEDLPNGWRPKTYSLTFKAAEWSDVKAKFDEIKATKPWHWQGLVIHTGAGAQRWRFRNVEHDRVRRNLRGTESNPFGRFLRLRANKKVQEYLRVYSEDSAAFQGYEHEYRTATKALYAWYCKCHKEHGLAFKALPKSVQPLVFGLHKHYLETLRPAHKTLRLTETIEWITEHLKSEYGVPNVIRLSKETEQPPLPSASTTSAKAPVAEFRDEVDLESGGVTPSVTDAL